MIDVDDNVGLAIEQNDVAADENVSAIRGRGWKTAFEFAGTGIEPFLQPRRERAVANELLLEARRQLVFLG
jgi:hypothetical protein